jgi:D-serine deaminase-like pyridoxal phosphate-dependent protein
VHITELRTPAVLVDEARVARNIERMQSLASRYGKRLRPHAKTHKSPELARRQIAQGAVGICCAKIGEAEVFADAGIEEIRIPYPINPVNADRVLALLDRTHLSFIVDHLDVARGWSRAIHGGGQQVDVLVKVDVGFHRCGIDPERLESAEFVAAVAALPGLRFRGLLSHAGHAYGSGSSSDACTIAKSEARTLTGLAARVRELGVEVEEISVGATPTARFSAEQGGITELRPGNYVYFDRAQVSLGAATWDDCALTVLARVVSRPADDRIILDCGSKTLTTDLACGGSVPGHGAVCQALDMPTPNDSLTIERLSEEHAIVRVRGQGTPLVPGDLVRVIPNHSCVVSNLMDAVWLVRDACVSGRLEIAARGRIA